MDVRLGRASCPLAFCEIDFVQNAVGYRAGLTLRNAKDKALSVCGFAGIPEGGDLDISAAKIFDPDA
ncbi:hypothetical protein ADT71_15295 [Novosphingobium sp. ST904]|nr:hypothetical protein ADT71_15295 [Novosphingobium sp. ST904]